MNPSSSSHFGPGPCRFHSRRPVLHFRRKTKISPQEGSPINSRATIARRPRALHQDPQLAAKADHGAGAARPTQCSVFKSASVGTRTSTPRYLNHPLRRRSAILRFCRRWRCSAANYLSAIVVGTNVGVSASSALEIPGLPAPTMRQAAAHAMSTGDWSVRARRETLRDYPSELLVAPTPATACSANQLDTAAGPKSRSANMPHPSDW